MVEPDRPQITIRCMLMECWITKATNTQSEYVIFIAFLLQQQFSECASMLRLSTLLLIVFAFILQAGLRLHIKWLITILWTQCLYGGHVGGPLHFQSAMFLNMLVLIFVTSSYCLLSNLACFPSFCETHVCHRADQKDRKFKQICQDYIFKLQCMPSTESKTKTLFYAFSNRKQFLWTT